MMCLIKISNCYEKDNGCAVSFVGACGVGTGATTGVADRAYGYNRKAWKKHYNYFMTQQHSLSFHL
jgi:hypothetical protein